MLLFTTSCRQRTTVATGDPDRRMDIGFTLTIAMQW